MPAKAALQWRQLAPRAFSYPAGVCPFAALPPLRSEGQRHETAAFLAPLLGADCFEGVQVGCLYPDEALRGGCG